jgi:phosphate acetyltransferase
VTSNSIVSQAAYTTDAVDTSVHRAPQTHEKYERLIAQAQGIPAIPTAVDWPCEEHALAGPFDAAEENIITPVFVGPAKRIHAVAQKAGLDISRFEIVDVATEEEAAAAAVRRVRDRHARSRVKGSQQTQLRVQQVVGKVGGVGTVRRKSHLFFV